MSTKYIRIDETQVLNNQTVVSKLSFSNNVKKYFRSSLFFAEYDKAIQNVSMSILHIPVISNIITLAWAVGADVYVKELDRTYLESLNKIKFIMKRWYPNFPFSTNIHAEEIVSNKSSNEKHGLLFSGGVDSYASYIRNRSKKPVLITAWGSDIPLSEEALWRKIKNKCEQFAKDEKQKITFVKTNMREFTNESLLVKEFGKYLPDLSWWGGIQHGIGMLGLCAPIALVEHIGTLFIASSFTKGFSYPWGSHPLIDNNLSWADVKVVHDGYELSRQEKIHVLANYITNSERYPFLRVCWSQFRYLNCGECEKCLRTITGLVLENIDPNKCGFNIDNDLFDFLEHWFKFRGGFHLAEAETFMWKDIQRHIPQKLSHNLYNCQEFFEWFKSYDFSMNTNRKNFGWWLLYILNKLPKCARVTIAKLSKVLRSILKRKYPFI